MIPDITTINSLNGNASTKTLKASFCKVSPDEKGLFADSHMMLLISIGNRRQRGKYLAATIDLIKGKFKHYTIMVCDVLQRHNLMSQFNLTDAAAYSRALEEGDNWLNGNLPILNQLNHFTVVRWSRWLNDRRFNDYKKMIEREYERNFSYRESIIKAAQTFSNRTSDLSRRDCSLNSSINYLLEECSAMLLWINEGYNYELYPGERNLAMANTYELFIKPTYPHLLKAISLRFK